MKKIITGAVLVFAGMSMFLAVFIVASNYVATMTSWYTHLGRFWSAVSELNLMSVMVIGVVLMIIGIGVMIWGNRVGSD